MAKNVKDNTKHVGGIASNNDKPAEKENKNKPSDQDVKGSDKKRSAQVSNDAINQNDVNVMTDKSAKLKGKELTKELWSKHNIIWKIRNLGLLGKMSQGEAYFRTEKGQLLHSDYVIKMWNKVKAAQTAAKSVSTITQMASDAIDRYEAGRRLR